MMQFLLPVIILYAASLLVYGGVKKYLYKKYNFKKKHLLIAMFVILVVQTAIVYVTKIIIIQYVFTVLFVVCMLVFMDVLRKEREIKNRPVVGRPKPKPNRAGKND